MTKTKIARCLAWVVLWVGLICGLLVNVLAITVVVVDAWQQNPMAGVIMLVGIFLFLGVPTSVWFLCMTEPIAGSD